MKSDIRIPELIMMAATRAIAGAGLGLVLGDRVKKDQRKAIGWTLFAIGALSTIPLAFEFFGRKQAPLAINAGYSLET